MLAKLSAQCLTNSRRWFPGPHARGLESAIILMTLGIAGESGEVVEVIKKALRSGYLDELPYEALAHEIVDVMVYCLNLAELCGIDLDSAFEQKMAVCEQRYQERINS
jgi:NTP pyrophosphatase (non-canonical NTP hydrolase)